MPLSDASARRRHFFMREQRTFNLEEIRAEGDGDIMRVRGHAAVFNQKSVEMFDFREVIKPGAFKRAIKEDDVRALWNHDPNFVLGRTRSGTLKLIEDDIGLRTDIAFPNTQYARDIFALIQRNDINQMSFGFRTITDVWRKEDRQMIRELHEVELFDVSPITFPAYPQTDISARDFYQQRMAESIKAHCTVDFIGQMKAREAFLSNNIPSSDPYDLREILRKVSSK